MSNIVPPVLIELQLETAKIRAQMEQMNTDFKKFGQTVEQQSSFLSRFKAAASGVFAGNLMTQGMNVLQQGIMGAIKDAQELEVIMAKTNAVIASTGGVAGISAEQIRKQAAALEQMSAVDENVIQNGENVIATFTQIRNVAGEGNDIFNQTTKAALDLSAALGQDMQSSSIQLGKALNDPIKGVTALQRVGVTFDAQQKQMIKTMVESGDTLGAQKVILAEVNREFGGAAKAAGDTFAGAVFRAKDKVQDFARDLITNLQPILLNIGKTVAWLYDTALKPLFTWIGKNKEAVLIFVGVIGTAIAAFKIYQFTMAAVTAAQELYIVATALLRGAKLADIAATEGQTGAMVLLNAVINASPVMWLVGAVALLAAGFVVAWNKVDWFRQGVVEAMKGAVMGVGYLIKIFGVLVQAIMNVATGPMQLLLKGLALLKVPGAKEALNELRNPINAVGDFFDKAGNAVQDYADKLDSLKDKKISIPGFGSKKTDGTTVTDATAPTTVTADKIKADAAAAKKHANDVIKANEDVMKTYDKMSKVIKDATEKRTQIEDDYTKKVASITQDFADKKIAIEKDYAEKATALEQDAAQKRADIVQKSRDLLINAFQNATKIDLAKMFDDSDKSGAGLVEKMKAKLAAVLQLQKNAGALASQGFSQTFIQDVVSQGPDAGNAMANAILSATPETITEMKDLYGQIQTVSETGMNALAEQMSTDSTLATSALTKEYANVSVELQKALTKNSNELADSLAKNQKELQDALIAAQTAYNEAIDSLNKDTMDKLATLQDELKKTAETIAALSGAKAGVAALAASPAAPYLAGTATIQPVISTPSVGNNLNITQNITTTSQDPAAVTSATIAAIKYGSPAYISKRTGGFE